MSVASRPLQQVRPSSEPELWTGYNDPNGGIRNDISRDEIARIVASGDGTLWVDIDTRDPNDVSILSDVFHFHPLAIEEATNPQSRVKLEEYDKYLLLIVRTVGFCETTDDPYDLDTVNISFFLGKNFLVTVHGGCGSTSAPKAVHFVGFDASAPLVNALEQGKLEGIVVQNPITSARPTPQARDTDRTRRALRESGSYAARSVRRPRLPAASGPGPCRADRTLAAPRFRGGRCCRNAR